MKIDLGCGKFKTDGLIGIDIMPHKNVDIVHDLDQIPYPFKNNSVSYIQANHILEHLPNFIKTVEELYRICKNSAIIEIR